jgi:hypothetical protein
MQRETALFKQIHCAVNIAFGIYRQQAQTKDGDWPSPESARFCYVEASADELVLEAAVNGRASAIVTHNVRDFLPAARDFKIEVITPSIMLHRVRK